MPTLASMQALGWGNPHRSGYAGKHIVTMRRHGAAWTVNRAALGTFELVVDTLVDHRSAHWLTVKADDWGFYVRPIRGSSGGDESLSYHAFGDAIDVNAATNPSVSSPAAGRTDMPVKAIHELEAEIARLSRGKVTLVWGGDWHSPYDPMHFELHGEHADVAELSAAIRAGKARIDAPGPKGRHVEWPAVTLGSQGRPVRHLQRLLNEAGFHVAVDGDYGPQTRRAVERFKASHGLGPSDRIGSRGWAALEKAAA